MITMDKLQKENAALKEEIEQHRQNAMKTITIQKNRIDDLVHQRDMMRKRAALATTRAEAAEAKLAAALAQDVIIISKSADKAAEVESEEQDEKRSQETK